MTRSRKTAKRLGPEDAALLAAHVQGQFEAEKARIARRLHGDVAGMLAAARMDLSRLAGAHLNDDGLREQVGRVDQILEAVIHNARSEMQRLHPALLDHFGLSAALRHLVEETCRASAAEYVVDLPEFTDGRLAAPVALAAYRVVETLLASGPRRVAVRLREGFPRLALQIDLERAEATEPAANKDLLALRTWLETLGASWSEVERVTATSLELSLPLQVEAAATATPAS